MAIKMDNYGNVYDDELFHYGVPGMKWGKNIMAGKKQISSGVNRSAAGVQDMNTRMRNDRSGIRWKSTVAPSGGFKPAVRTTSTDSRFKGTQYEKLFDSRLPHMSRTSANATILKANGGKGYVSRNNEVVKKSAKRVVPTSNPAVKGVNTTPQGGFGAKTYTSKKAEMLKNKDTMHLGGVEKPQRGARNALVLNSSVSNRVGSAMKKGIKAVQSKPDKIKKAKKKAAVGILKLASKLMKWF